MIQFPNVDKLPIDAKFLERMMTEKFLFAKENNDLFAICIEDVKISFNCPKFGVTHKTEESPTTREFFIEVFESKPYMQCFTRIDEDGDVHILEKYKDGKDEIYGIVYKHSV